MTTANKSREATDPIWRIGELAKLFGINVQTLHFYDRIGLFKPAERDPNNDYRYYSQTQLYTLANIIYLRKQGYSIKDIREHTQQLDFLSRVKDLEKQATQLALRAKYLEFLSHTIRAKTDYVRRLSHKIAIDDIRVIKQATCYYYEMGLEAEIYPTDVFYFFPTVVIYEKGRKIFGAVLPDNTILNTYKDILQSHFDLTENMCKLPPQTVLRGYHLGPYEAITDRVTTLHEHAASHKLRLADHSIHYNIIDQFVEKNPERYITEIHIPVLA